MSNDPNILVLRDVEHRLREFLEKDENQVQTVHSATPRTGHVTEFADGVARISGLEDVRVGSRVLFPQSTVRAKNVDESEPVIYGMVVDIDEYDVGCLVFGEERFIKEADFVTLDAYKPLAQAGAGFRDGVDFHSIIDTERNGGSGEPVTIMVSDEMLGTVVDPLGHRLADDCSPGGNGTPWRGVAMPLERASLGIIHRQKIESPLLTGITAVDTMLPIGCGQRMLIIGDRSTGKTSIAVDTIKNQVDDNTISVYVAIGKKASEVKLLQNELVAEQGRKKLRYVIVAAMANDPAPLIYVAPFAGMAIAEYFRDIGKKVIIVFDDLTRHAAAYRQISLILKRPPGREAFPGDVFYLHSRLLERACQPGGEVLEVRLRTMIENNGKCAADLKLEEIYAPYFADGTDGIAKQLKATGSLTALPIIETKQSDYSAYIPTNVISITDGQVYLDSALFLEGQLPAVNVGISVSRVGTSAQPPFMKLVARKLRTSLASFRDQEKFAKYGVTDDAVQRTIRWGRVTLAMLKQGRNARPLLEQIVATFLVSVSPFNLVWENVHFFMDDYIPEPNEETLQNPKAFGEKIGGKKCPPINDVKGYVLKIMDLKTLEDHSPKEIPEELCYLDPLVYGISKPDTSMRDLVGNPVNNKDIEDMKMRLKQFVSFVKLTNGICIMDDQQLSLGGLLETCNLEFKKITFMFEEKPIEIELKEVDKNIQRDQLSKDDKEKLEKNEEENRSKVDHVKYLGLALLDIYARRFFTQKQATIV